LRKLFFARDPLGRRSLLVHWPSNELPHLVLTSVSTGMRDCHEFVELPTEYIYALNLDNIDENSAVSLDHSMGCLSRAVPVDHNAIHVPFVRVSLAKPSSYYFEALCAHRRDLGG
jgi:hypothetical protein